jgi:hypothetical protein
MLSPLDAEISAAENGVQMCSATRISNSCVPKAEIVGLTGSGKNSAKAKDSEGSPRRELGWELSRSGREDL